MARSFCAKNRGQFTALSSRIGLAMHCRPLRDKPGELLPRKPRSSVKGTAPMDRPINNAAQRTSHAPKSRAFQTKLVAGELDGRILRPVGIGKRRFPIFPALGGFTNDQSSRKKTKTRMQTEFLRLSCSASVHRGLPAGPAGYSGGRSEC